MVITVKVLDEEGNVISEDVKEIAVWTADIDDTDLSIDRNGESIPLRQLPHDSYLITEEPGFTIGEGQGTLEPRPVAVHIGPFSELTITKHKTFDEASENALKLVIWIADENATFVTEATFQKAESDAGAETENSDEPMVFADLPAQEVTVTGLAADTLYRVVDMKKGYRYAKNRGFLSCNSLGCGFRCCIGNNDFVAFVEKESFK